MISPNQQVLYPLLQQRSAWTANQMYLGYVHSIPQRETTITEVNLLAIVEAWPGLVTTFLDESETGADWQWKTQGGPKLLIQAKIMDIRTKSYSHLDHLVGGPGGRYQVDILLKYAQAQNAYAFYVLYNSGEPDHNGQFNPADHGCFVVSAEAMNKQITQHVNATHIRNSDLTWEAIKSHAHPWEQLAQLM